jgi:hypothetical protein
MSAVFVGQLLGLRLGDLDGQQGGLALIRGHPRIACRVHLQHVALVVAVERGAALDVGEARFDLVLQLARHFRYGRCEWQVRHLQPKADRILLAASSNERPHELPGNLHGITKASSRLALTLYCMSFPSSLTNET